MTDAVAQAIFEYDWGGEPVWKRDFTKLNADDQDHYRRMAQAAIDTLGLTEEWRCIGWAFTRDEEAAWKQHEATGREVQSRLVSPWVRKDNTNE